MSPAVLKSLQVGLPRPWGQADAVDPMDQPWTTGFYKQPVTGPVQLERTHLEGDGQADLVHHGGADKAVLAYSADHYPDWRATLDKPSLPFGAFGENFTISGLTERDVCIGDTWHVGDEVVVQISQPRQPCWKLARRWRIKTLAADVQETGRTGWYFRVLTGGAVSAGMGLDLHARPYPDWTVARANRVMHVEKSDVTAALGLAAIPLLSANWRASLLRRVDQQPDDPRTRLFGESR